MQSKSEELLENRILIKKLHQEQKLLTATRIELSELETYARATTWKRILLCIDKKLPSFLILSSLLGYFYIRSLSSFPTLLVAFSLCVIWDIVYCVVVRDSDEHLLQNIRIRQMTIVTTRKKIKQLEAQLEERSD